MLSGTEKMQSCVVNYLASKIKNYTLRRARPAQCVIFELLYAYGKICL